jgi:ArsR family transcriptional regulator
MPRTRSLKPAELAADEGVPAAAGAHVGYIHELLGALGDHTRTRLLVLLERHELSVNELCAAVGLPQSTVSRHLQVLSRAELVSSRSEGTSRYYRLGPLDEVAEGLWQAVRGELETSPDTAGDEARALRAIELRRTELEQVFVRLTTAWDAERLRLFGPGVELKAFPALLDPGWVVADLGCGTGIVAEALAPYVARVIGVDASPYQLKEAARRLRDAANVELRQARLEALPLESGSVDAAVLALVLHYVPEPRQALREAARILKRGGRLLVVDVTAHTREEYRLRLGHVWQGFTRAQLQEWLEGCGLGEVRFHDLPTEREAAGPPLFTAAARKNGKQRRAE